MQILGDSPREHTAGSKHQTCGLEHDPRNQTTQYCLSRGLAVLRHGAATVVKSHIAAPMRSRWPASMGVSLGRIFQTVESRAPGSQIRTSIRVPETHCSRTAPISQGTVLVLEADQQRPLKVIHEDGFHRIATPNEVLLRSQLLPATPPLLLGG
ncbi:hypothetical protein N658DRAFT_29861 [Parathielavia hyrcaniae]|uniref:Uncharacterized protein n=1 Tax=Parathielavia hyrcaniae TaxID=113614 RepID=A0AAN6QDH4_9PEZI|nr:hypothetical protein N658DRAFT_29861 [Parathielavia hyrcaniae]